MTTLTTTETVAIEVTTVLKDYKQIATNLNEGDFELNTITLVLEDGTEIETELFGANISTKNGEDALLEGIIFINKDLEEVTNQLAESNIAPFKITTWDWDFEEQVEKYLNPTETTLTFELVEN